MNISINTDLEKEYRNELVKGFSWQEVLCGVAAVLVVLGCAYVCYSRFGLSPKYGCYIGIPFAFPIVFLGFRKFQGMNVIEYLREIIFHQKTKDLAYDAEEFVEELEVFTLRGGKKNEKNRK